MAPLIKRRLKSRWLNLEHCIRKLGHGMIASGDRNSGFFRNGFADHYPYFLWLFHWGYTPFSDIPKWPSWNSGFFTNWTWWIFPVRFMWRFSGEGSFHPTIDERWVLNYLTEADWFNWLFSPPRMELKQTSSFTIQPTQTGILTIWLWPTVRHGKIHDVFFSVNHRTFD